MPKFSKISNKTHTTLSINAELLKKAKEKGLNISLLLDAALEREVNPEAREAFFQAIINQNKNYKGYIQKTKQSDEFDEFKLGKKENVVEEKKAETKVREPIRTFEQV